MPVDNPVWLMVTAKRLWEWPGSARQSITSCSVSDKQDAQCVQKCSFIPSYSDRVNRLRCGVKAQDLWLTLLGLIVSHSLSVKTAVGSCGPSSVLSVADQSGSSEAAGVIICGQTSKGKEDAIALCSINISCVRKTRKHQGGSTCYHSNTVSVSLKFSLKMSHVTIKSQIRLNTRSVCPD